MVRVAFLLVVSSLSFLEHASCRPTSYQFIPCATDTEDLVNNAWIAFKNQYNKRYPNITEENRRKQIFYDTLKLIADHNLLYETNQSTYTMGINQFSDMEFSEIAMGYLGDAENGYDGEVEVHGEAGGPGDFGAAFRPSPNKTRPPCVDWRERGYVTRVKDQGKCGSCWAFSAIGSLEGQMKKKTGRLVSLSEQNLVDCSERNGGCKGGWPHWAYLDINEDGGISTEARYPYQAKDKICRYNPKHLGATVRGYRNIPSGNEAALTDAIAYVGPISVAMHFHENLQHYDYGVFDSSSCNAPSFNHAVLAVGYGTYEREDYYLLKNSWGYQWGDKGYFRIARNKDNLCGIASRAVYPLV